MSDEIATLEAEQAENDGATLLTKSLKPAPATPAAEKKEDDKPPVVVAEKTAGDESDKPREPEKSEDMAVLLKRIADMEKQLKGRGEVLDGEYAKAKFITKNCGDLPLELAELYIPATTDSKKIGLAEQTLRKVLKDYVFKTYPHLKTAQDFGNGMNDGGTTPDKITENRATVEPTKLLSRSLKHSPTPDSAGRGVETSAFPTPRRFI